jgi:hypothetical protein
VISPVVSGNSPTPSGVAPPVSTPPSLLIFTDTVSDAPGIFAVISLVLDVSSSNQFVIFTVNDHDSNIMLLNALDRRTYNVLFHPNVTTIFPPNLVVRVCH